MTITRVEVAVGDTGGGTWREPQLPLLSFQDLNDLEDQGTSADIQEVSHKRIFVAFNDIQPVKDELK